MESHEHFRRCYALAARWHAVLNAFVVEPPLTNVEVSQAAMFFAGRMIGRILVGAATAPEAALAHAVATLELDEAVTLHVRQFEDLLRLGIMSAVEVNRGDMAEPPEDL